MGGEGRREPEGESARKVSLPLPYLFFTLSLSPPPPLVHAHSLAGSVLLRVVLEEDLRVLELDEVLRLLLSEDLAVDLLELDVGLVVVVAVEFLLVLDEDVDDVVVVVDEEKWQIAKRGPLAYRPTIDTLCHAHERLNGFENKTPKPLEA